MKIDARAYTFEPCPFCGGTDMMLIANPDEDERMSYHVECADCNACGPVSDKNVIQDDDQNMVVELWNRRPDRDHA